MIRGIGSVLGRLLPLTRPLHDRGNRRWLTAVLAISGQPRRNDLGAAPQAVITPGTLPSARWASLRLFQIAPGDLVGIEIKACPACGGAMRIIACDGEVRRLHHPQLVPED
jgi:hypothetical protein